MLDRIQKAQNLCQTACKHLGRQINIMEVCGTHTVAIFRSGIRSTLPKKIKLLSGPGCPVCVTDQGYIDIVLLLAERRDCLIATYGDIVRVPGSSGSLETKQPSDNIKVVLSSEDALQLAKDNPDKDFYAATELAVCPNMKRITLYKIVWSLENLKDEVRVADDIRRRARKAIDAMLRIT